MSYPCGCEWDPKTNKGPPTLPVDMLTRRDDEGVYYSVSVGDSGATDADYWGGWDGMVEVWSMTVNFGATPDHHAGGAAFREAAREQERVAEEWVRFLTGAGSETP